jgi:hypothetical protein
VRAGRRAQLCEGEQNGGWIPINKNLWSLSFILALSAGAFIMLSLFYGNRCPVLVQLPGSLPATTFSLAAPFLHSDH